MSAWCRTSRDRVRAVWYPAKPAPTITMRGRATVRLRRCRVHRAEPSASPWSGPPNVRRFPLRPPGTRTPTSPSDHTPAEVLPMPEYGYFLSCEEFGPADLVEQAR